MSTNSPHLPSELLPVQVRLATSADDYQALAQLRARAYGRHDYLPQATEKLLDIDVFDQMGGLLVAECKATGTLLGTLRVSSSLRGLTPIPPALVLDELAGEPFGYTDRFAVEKTPHADLIALALIKAQWFWAFNEGVRWIVAAALPSLARRYRMVGLRTLRGTEQGLALPHLHESRYEALGERLVDMPLNLRMRAPSLQPFFLWTHHPDILLPQCDELKETLAICQHWATTGSPERPRTEA